MVKLAQCRILVAIKTVSSATPLRHRDLGPLPLAKLPLRSAGDDKFCLFNLPQGEGWDLCTFLDGSAV